MGKDRQCVKNANVKENENCMACLINRRTKNDIEKTERDTDKK